MANLVRREFQFFVKIDGIWDLVNGLRSVDVIHEFANEYEPHTCTVNLEFLSEERFDFRGLFAQTKIPCVLSFNGFYACMKQLRQEFMYTVLVKSKVELVTISLIMRNDDYSQDPIKQLGSEIRQLTGEV